MAIYHFSGKIISRSNGHTALAASAYRACSKITDSRTGEIHDYSRKSGNVYSEILLPDTAPKEYADRSILWNSVEEKEIRKDAQLCREFDAALPAAELTEEQRIELARSFARHAFVDDGMVVQLDIHDNKDGNPHAHFMVSMREVSGDGWGNKNREWNQNFYLMNWRVDWEEEVNRSIAEAQKEWDKFGTPIEYVTSKSLAAQGIERPPQIHLGKYAARLEKKGIESDRGKVNRAVATVAGWVDGGRVAAMETLRQLTEWIEKAKKELVRQKQLEAEKNDVPQSPISPESEAAQLVAPAPIDATAAEDPPKTEAPATAAEDTETTKEKDGKKPRDMADYKKAIKQRREEKESEPKPPRRIYVRSDRER